MTDRSHTPDLLVGVDVGGSKIAVLVVDPDLQPRARFTLPTRVGAPDSAADAIAGAIRAALGDGGLDVADVAAVGIGVPGRVEPDTGTVSLAVNLGWHDLPLGPQLAARLGVPVRLENDVRAAAAGLLDRRVLGDVEDLAFVSIGTGIAAGVILDGRLHRGRRGLAGEIGHIVLDPAGRLCACGLRGCLEALAAGPAIAAAARDAVESGRETVLARVDAPSAIDVYEAATAGDAVATDIAETVGRHIARAVHELVMVYDVEVVVLGGGVARAGDAFLAPILRALDAMREASSLAREVLRPGVVHLLPPAAEAGSWGAVALARAAAGSDRRSPVAGREVGDS
ncbi:MAG: ROK family protein [Chloroflexota bacterium]